MTNDNDSEISSKTSKDSKKQHKGVVVRYNDVRKFGFIKCSKKETQLTKDIFFHKSNVSKSTFNPKIKQGDKCRFDIDEGEKGKMAINININHRPIAKKIGTENDLKIELFTQTMLKFFDAATSIQKTKNKI